MEYKKIAASAAEKYQSMEETSELYKRNYIKINLNEAEITANTESSARLAELRKKFEGLGLHFNLISDGSTFECDSEKVKVYEVKKDAKLPEGIVQDAYDKHMAFVQAYTTQVVVIEVEENEHAEVNMLLYASNSLNMQVFVKAGAGASIDIVEVLASSDMGKELGLINSVVAGKGAKVNINVLHNECGNAKVLSFYDGEADEISSISINSMFAGGLLTKSKSMLSAKGNGSSVSIGELVIASDNQGFDINGNVFNSGKASHSSIDSKAIAMGKALCILKGRAEIAYNSSASDSVIAERGLIIGPDAKIETIPSMEVLENEVRASHSSAVAPIDITSAEYLMSRGISREDAYTMLALGILNGLIAKFNNKFVDIIYSIARQRLNGSKIGAIADLKTVENFMHNTIE